MRRTPILGLLPLLLLAAWACAPWDDPHAPWSAQQPGWGPRFEINDPRVVECSGLATSRQYPGVGWIHNDSGNSAHIFALDARGRVLTRVEIEGARNVDWEDIALDEHNRLYLCDVGNNHSRREDLRIYVIDEPSPSGQESAVVLRTLRVHYPEQEHFPDPERRFDCEAAFFHEGSLYLITKHALAGPSWLYRVVDLESEEDQALRRVDEFDTLSQVTGADLSPDGHELAVLSYEYIDLYQLDPGGAYGLGIGGAVELEADVTLFLSSAPVVRIPIEARQAEAIAYDGDTLRVLNEQSEIHLFSRKAIHAGGEWSSVEAPDSFVLLEDAPAELRAGYLPPRDTFELPEDDMAQLPLGKGFGEKRQALPAAPDTASVMLQREGEILRVGLRWTSIDGGNDDGILGWIAWGPVSQRILCGPGDNALRVMYDEHGSPALLPEQIAPDSVIPAHSLQRRGKYIEGWIELPLAAEANAKLALSVVLLSPSGADWHFGGDSSMFAWRNPVLWGVLD